MIENENVSVAFHLRLREARARLGSNGVLAHPRYCWMTLPDFAGSARGWGLPPEMREMADVPAWVHKLVVRARANKQKTPTTAEANVNVERRTHNKRETDARYREWQEGIKKLAQDFPGKTHVAYCRMLASKIGVSSEHIRRHTTRLKS